MEVVEYSVNWKTWFEIERKHLEKLIPGIEIVEHVGSTSIPGQESKPIVDIFVGVRELLSVEKYRKILGDSYDYIDTGMAARHLFHKVEETSREFNVHLLPFDERFFERNEFMFRDYLLSHHELVEEYGKIKQDLIKKFGYTREYTFAKTPFIQRVVDMARTEKGLQLQDVWE